MGTTDTQPGACGWRRSAQHPRGAHRPLVVQKHVRVPPQQVTSSAVSSPRFPEHRLSCRPTSSKSPLSRSLGLRSPPPTAAATSPSAPPRLPPQTACRLPPLFPVPCVNRPPLRHTEGGTGRAPAAPARPARDAAWPPVAESARGPGPSRSRAFHSGAGQPVLRVTDCRSLRRCSVQCRGNSNRRVALATK